MQGPTNPVSEFIHAEKYRAKGESFLESTNRIAAALTESKDEFRAFREVLREMRFLPGGRIQAAVGSPKSVTAYNCFVSATIEDSFVEGQQSIMGVATSAATTMRMGGGIGYDFSTLRPRGARIRKLDSKSSGPLAFMGIFDAICQTVQSAGHRRGAQMGVLRVDHPDIEEFIHAKQNSGKLTGFNISIAVTDEFMQAVSFGRTFDLRWGGEVFDTIDARALWEKIMRSTWDWAEPGVLFIDRINGMNPLGYCEHIAATNPCGEQPLPPHGACLLGSFNLTRYIVEDAGDAFGTGNRRGFDWNQFREDIPRVVRAMDRVIDVSDYPLPEQKQEAHEKRRMGLGVTGVANAIEALGHPYGSESFCGLLADILAVLRDEAYRASAYLAEERGAFPMFDAKLWLNSGFGRSLPNGVRAVIAEKGLRNSHLLSIAPTGTISLTADNVSSGIEPVFSVSTRRTIQTFDGPEEHVVEDYGWARWGVEPRSAAQVTAQEHVAVLAVAQRFMDSAVSKTCNVSPDMPWDEFKQLYLDAWRSGCKGLTTFNSGGKRMGILKEEKHQEGASCRIDPETGRQQCE